MITLNILTGYSNKPYFFYHPFKIKTTACSAKCFPSSPNFYNYLNLNIYFNVLVGEDIGEDVGEVGEVGGRWNAHSFIFPFNFLLYFSTVKSLRGSGEAGEAIFRGPEFKSMVVSGFLVMERYILITFFLMFKLCSLLLLVLNLGLFSVQGLCWLETPEAQNRLRKTKDKLRNVDNKGVFCYQYTGKYKILLQLSDYLISGYTVQTYPPIKNSMQISILLPPLLAIKWLEYTNGLMIFYVYCFLLFFFCSLMFLYSLKVGGPGGVKTYA